MNSPSHPLPRGQFLQRETDDLRFALYRQTGERRLWITAIGLADPELAAGPVEPHDAVRALRIANLSIPEGCELGPWRPGIGTFVITSLPGELEAWTRVVPSSLEPSLTRYVPEDIRDERGERVCCAPPTAPPEVVWDDEDTEDVGWESPPDLLGRAVAPILARYPEVQGARLGLLLAAWNGHPENCLVFAPSGALAQGFYVADFEFPEGTDFGRPRAE